MGRPQRPLALGRRPLALLVGQVTESSPSHLTSCFLCIEQMSCLQFCQHSDRIISRIAYPVWQFGDAGLSFGPVDCLSHVSCLMFEALGLRALDEQVTELHLH
jgi:hypothetical protein